MKKIIIIGAVAAGMSAAAKAIRLDKTAKITVYEKTEVVSLGACGLPYYVGGFFDDYKEMIARTSEDIIKSGIDLKINHEVLSVDAKNKTVKVKDTNTDKTFEDSYDSLLVATGAYAALPPIENINLKNIYTLKELKDSMEIKEKLKDEKIKNTVIIGAGFIGIEAAHALRHLSKNVKVIELLDHVLGDTFDIDMSEKIASHIKEKIDLHFEEKVRSFESDGDGKVKAVITDKGKYDCDLVIVSSGFKPNTDFIKDTGINLIKNGAILINREGESSIPSIYAVGDCATIYNKVLDDQTYTPLATGANKLGRMVASNLVGGNHKFQGSLASACILAFDLEVARTGITEAEAKKRNIPYKTTVITDKDHTSYYPPQEDITVKIIYSSENRKILGGQIIGKKGAVLRADVLAACIFSSMTVDDLGMLDLCYAPPFSRTWDALNVAGNVSK